MQGGFIYVQIWTIVTGRRYFTDIIGLSLCLQSLWRNWPQSNRIRWKI